MTIKVIKDLPKWEVMRRHEEEGARVATRSIYAEEWKETTDPTFNFYEWNYAIIDDSNPVIDWEKFDREFFNQYGGVKVSSFKNWIMTHYENQTPFRGETLADVKLRESPWYPWFGGDCPVPENVEVEIECADGFVNDAHGDIERTRETMLARDVEWNYDRVIAFRLTGRVL